MRRALLLAVALVLNDVCGVKRLDLMAAEGEIAGKYAFEGGEPEATCKACKAVMEHIERQMAKPYYDEFHHTYKEKQKRGIDSRRLNKIDRINSVLDASSCRKEMEAYDLAYIGGQNVFQYKPPGVQSGGMGYPVHMELNEWAKNELGMFCESLIEEYEEELTTLLLEDEEENQMLGKPNATMRVCDEQLALCVPPPPPPPPKKEKKKKPKTRKQLLAEARKVFDNMDEDGNGWIDYEEMKTRLKRFEESGQMKEGRTVEEELDDFFSKVDKDKNGKVNFYEYKFMWVQPRDKEGEGGGGSDGSGGSGAVPGAVASDGSSRGLDYYIGSTLADLLTELPGVGEFVESAPVGAVLGSLGVTTAALCVGGRAALRR